MHSSIFWMEQTLNTAQSDLFFLWSLCFLALWPCIRICGIPWRRPHRPHKAVILEQVGAY
jgi:hypothetical protein